MFELAYDFERAVNQILFEATIGNELDTTERFENDVFEIVPYSWAEDAENEWHFFHKPSGLKLQWYKYPLRGVQSNIDISHEQFLDVLRDCTNSLHPRFTNEITKWWEKIT